MTHYRIIASSIILASSLGFLAAPVFAAPQKCGPMGERGNFFEHRTERMEQQHKKLHETLKLTSDQEGAWKKLTDSQQQMAKMPSMQPDEWAKLTTPERAEKMLAQMKEHQTLMTEHVVALKELYAVLTPEQKKLFDDFHSGSRNGMRGKPKRRSSETGMTSPIQ